MTEYTGELLNEEEALDREKSYTEDDGSYMYFFRKGRRLLWLVNDIAFNVDNTQTPLHEHCWQHHQQTRHQQVVDVVPS